jgi:iron complex outermembrane recepter protein
MNQSIRLRAAVVGLSCVAILLSFGPHLWADVAKVSDNVFDLGVIEVNAKGEKAKNVTVDEVREQDMREFNRDTVTNTLNLLPGVTLSQVGARNEGMFYVRGLDSKHVPMFLDGIPIYVPYDGYPDLNRFTTFDLSEITLTKGFTSILYGPSTMGGAVNLVSKRPEKPFEGNAGIGWFSGNGYQGYANFGTSRKLWYAQGGVSYLSSDYFVLSSNFKRSTVARTEDGGQREDSYYRDRKYNLKFGLTPAEGHEYALSYWNQHGVKGVPPYTGIDSKQTVRYWEWPYWDKEGLYFNSKTPLGDKSYAKTRLYYDKFQNSLYSYDDATYNTMRRGSSFKSAYDDHTYGGSIELGTSLIPRNQLKLAGHYKVDVHKEHNEPNPYQRFEDRIYSIGAEDTITITPKLYSILGVSYDNLKTEEAEDWNVTPHKKFHRAYDQAWNPQGGIFYDLTDTAKLNFSISRTSRFPSIKDRYSYKLGTYIPNPDLKPERAINYELGYQDVFMKRFAFKTALFYRDIKGYIQSAQINSSTQQSQNIGHVEQYGFEVEARAPITEILEAGANYTYLDNNNRSNNDKLYDIPEQKVFVYGKLTPLKSLPLSILADLEYDSKRYCQSTSTTVRVAKSFTVVNAKATYEIVRGLQIEAGVKNLFDENYEINEGFPMAGRTYFSHLTYRF